MEDTLSPLVSSTLLTRSRNKPYTSEAKSSFLLSNCKWTFQSLRHVAPKGSSLIGGVAPSRLDKRMRGMGSCERSNKIRIEVASALPCALISSLIAMTSGRSHPVNRAGSFATMSKSERIVIPPASIPAKNATAVLPLPATIPSARDSNWACA